MLGSIYPGQILTLNIYIPDFNIPPEFELSTHKTVTVVDDEGWLPPTSCGTTNSSELSKTLKKSNKCTKLKYVIAFQTDDWYELFLKRFFDRLTIGRIDVFYVKKLPCPACFSMINGKCKCPLFLSRFNINVILMNRHLYTLPTPG